MDDLVEARGESHELSDRLAKLKEEADTTADGDFKKATDRLLELMKSGKVSDIHKRENFERIMLGLDSFTDQKVAKEVDRKLNGLEATREGLYSEVIHEAGLQSCPPEIENVGTETWKTMKSGRYVENPSAPSVSGDGSPEKDSDHYDDEYPLPGMSKQSWERPMGGAGWARMHFA